MKPQHLEPYGSVIETIGWTPLIRLSRVGAGYRTPIFGKAEYGMQENELLDAPRISR
jgi:cystathionine beta-synthase